MADNAESFLEAERVVNRLADHMKTMVAEAGSYSEAQISLTKTREDLQRLTGGLSDVVREVRAVVGAVKQVNVPELMAELRRVRELVEKSEDIASKRNLIVARATEESLASLAAIRDDLDLCKTQIAAEADRNRREARRSRVLMLVVGIGLMIATVLTEYLLLKLGGFHAGGI